MMSARKPSIKEVARAAGVSTQTISRVLNERPDVAPETRERILKVIDDLGYYPSALARSMIRQRSFTIGVVIAGLRYMGPSRTLTAIVSEADAQGYALLLRELPAFNFADVNPVLLSLLDRQVDGIIWAVPEVGDNHAWLREKENFPVPVVMMTTGGIENIPVVRLNNRLGAVLAVRHLVDVGCRKIGHISGPLDWWEARQRRQGWLDALAEAGLPSNGQRCVEGNWSSSSGITAARQLLTQFPDVDGIFAGNDQMALSVLLEASRHGRRVPQDLCVVGFDDMSEAAYFNPPLTTVVQDHQALGRAAVQALVQQIDEKNTGSLTMDMNPHLVVRESTRSRKCA